jgi:FeS assembly SUF system protein
MRPLLGEWKDRLLGRLGQEEANGTERAEDQMNEELRERVVEEGPAPEEAKVEETNRDVSDSPALQVRDRVIAVLKTVYDPEIPVDIYELGLVYGVEVTDDGEVHVTMTLTTPMCPVAETLPPEVEDKVRNVMGVRDVSLDLVWDPPWSVDMMSDAARLELNMM